MIVHTLWLLVSLSCLGGGARILGIFPLFSRSHHRFLHPLMETLALAGHEVVVYSPFPMDNTPPNCTHVILDNITPVEKLPRSSDDLVGLPQWKCLDPIFQMYKLVLDGTIEDKEIKKLLSSDEHFDLVITEPYTMQEFTLIFGHKFGAPVIGTQAFYVNSLINSHLGNPQAIAYMPDCCFSYSNRMSMIEKLTNTFAILRGLYIYHYHYLPSVEGKLRQHFPEMPPLLDMARNVSLMFVNDHSTADYPRPRVPTIIPVAGIHITPTKPLPQDIKRFMDDAPAGVILFSLGTYVPDELQPREYFDMHINVFKQLRQRVLWKTRKENIEGLPDNVLTVRWMPQQDVLAHPKCVLFITHGGLLSQHEAIYFGIPVVVIPYFYDQPRNARFYEDKGIGVSIRKDHITEETLSTAIQTVMTNPQYKENMRRMSRIFRDRPQSAAESIVFWTEYVLRHGGAGHLRPASTSLAWHQLALLDVLAVLTAGMVCAGAAIYLVLRKLSTVLCKHATLRTDSKLKVN